MRLLVVQNNPSVKSKAFSCPHCAVLTQQYWYEAYIHPMQKNDLPTIIPPDFLRKNSLDHLEDSGQREKIKAWAQKMAVGLPFTERVNEYTHMSLHNVWYSKCYNCEKFSIWLCDQLIYPQTGEAPPANPDMPDDIRRDYEEASQIFRFSPRGAAALLRLAIDKLCKQLGDTKKGINENIKCFVSNGLDVRIQKALDIVRVVGNNAVHPGQMDLRDDRVTAESLFKLINLIIEKLISEPKHVDELFDSLPHEAKMAIEKRDRVK